MQQAQTLKDAAKNLDPRQALEGEDLNVFVDRDESPRSALKLDLEDAHKPKYLLTGHRGAGKSTELAKLEQELQHEYCVLRFSVNDYLDLNDNAIEHVDILLAMVFKSAEFCTVPLPQELHRSIVELLNPNLEETKSSDTTAGGEVGFSIGEWGLKFKLEHATRRDIRKTISHKTTRLFEIINKISEFISNSLRGIPVLYIVEDLDKIDFKKAENIFNGYSNSLTTPSVGIIYTFPIALRHSRHYQQIKPYFNHNYDLPNFKICDQQGNKTHDYTSLKKIVSCRINEECFEENALDRIIMSSGGLTRMAISLTRVAVREARLKGREKVTLEDANRAVAFEMMDFQRLLNTDRVKKLRKVMTDFRVEDEEEYHQLLHSLSVLEYRNGKAWYDVHPIMKEALALLPHDDE